MDDLLNKLVAIKAESFVDGNDEDRPRQAGARGERQLSTRASSSACGSARLAKPRSACATAKRASRRSTPMSMRAAMQAFDLAVTPKEPAPAPKDGEKK